jgi:hypothetical protein
MKRPAAILLLAACVGYGRPTLTAPSSVATSIRPDPTITFSGLVVEGAPVTTYSEAGFTVSAVTASWTARTTYGNPAPFIEFLADAGTTVTGELHVSAGGAPFYFKAADLYSSLTPIPYTFTGLRGSTVVFKEAGTVPNTFGSFMTVSNSHSQDLIDTLSIALTNPAPLRGGNPMGLDNIVLTSPPFGSFDTPTSGVIGVAGSIAVTGWTLDLVQVTRVTV